MPSTTRRPRWLSRRRVLALLSALGSGGLAGCFSPHMGGPVSQLSVFNGTERSVTVSLAVSRLPSEDGVIDDTFALAADEGRDYPDPFTEDGRKRLTVVVEGDRRESYEWEAGADPSSSGVQIIVNDDEISVSQVAA